MTENEAIEALRLINTSRVHPFYSWEEMEEVRDIAISALKEVQQYRKNGTVKECREAVEKQEPKIPEFQHMLSDYVARFKCPGCGHYFDYDCTNKEIFYCNNCGCALRMEGMEDENT